MLDPTPVQPVASPVAADPSALLAEPLEAFAALAEAVAEASSGGGGGGGKRLRGSQVHDLRVAARRAEAALSVVDDLAGEEEAKALASVRKALRRLRRRAGRARDADVSLRQIRSIRPGCRGAQRAALERVTAALKTMRREARAELVEAAGDEPLGKFRRRARQVVAATSGAGSPAALGRASTRAVASALQRVEEAAREIERGPEHLHALRLRLKRLRYLMELAPALPGLVDTDGPAALRDTLRTLGDASDAQALLTLLREHAGHDGPGAHAGAGAGAAGLIERQQRAAERAYAQGLAAWQALRHLGFIERWMRAAQASAGPEPTADATGPRRANAPRAAASPAAHAGERVFDFSV